MLNGIILIVAGLLAAPTLIAGKGSAESLLKKIAPFQGWIGVVLFLWGVFGILGVIGTLGWLSLGVGGLILWMTIAANVALYLVLGLLLGFNLLNQYIFSKNPQMQAKSDQMRLKLAAKQKTIGIIAIVVGIWSIVAPYIFVASIVGSAI